MFFHNGMLTREIGDWILVIRDCRLMSDLFVILYSMKRFYVFKYYIYWLNRIVPRVSIRIFTHSASTDPSPRV